MPSLRLSYEESVRRLQKDYLESDVFPPMPDRMPRHDDDEPLGVSFFRTFVGEGDDLSNLSLTRTFFGRSEINDACFRNTDFTESSLCWNDFIDIDFTEAILARCDIRASVFLRVNFSHADLRQADLRHSTFQDCNFDGAHMDGITLTQFQVNMLSLSNDQKKVVNVVPDNGPEPEGG